MVVAARPDVFNHNLETVPSNYLTVASGRTLFPSDPAAAAGEGTRSPHLHQVRESWSARRKRNEVLQLMDDLRSADVDFLTIGQYLQPTRKHHEVDGLRHAREFKAYETVAYPKGFLLVSATLTRLFAPRWRRFPEIARTPRREQRADRPIRRRLRNAVSVQGGR